MSRKTVTLSLLTLFLFTGAALAQNDTASDDGMEHSMSDAQQECDREYQEDLADAEREDSAEEQAHDREEAESDYHECLADAQRDREEDDHEEDDHEDDHDEDERDEDGDDEAERLPVPESYTGDHISFDVTSTGIANYSVDGLTYFASVSAAYPAEFEYMKKEGAELELEGDIIEVKMVDNPRGVFRFEDDDEGRITVVFADGIEVREGDDRRGHSHNNLVLSGPNNTTARLFMEDDYEYDNGTLVASEEIRMVVFDAPGLSDRSDHSRRGIADGRIAAEVEVPKDRRPVKAEFSDVNVTLETTEDGLIAHVSREDPEGRTILFALEQDAFDLGALQILFDGEPIGLADDAEDVMDTSDGVPEYLILIGAEGAEVLVQVPYFSVHTIQLQGSVSSASVPAPSAGLVGAGILGLAAAVQAVRRH